MPIDKDFLKSQLVDIENERNAHQSLVDDLDKREKQVRAALELAETEQERTEENVTDSKRASNEK